MGEDALLALDWRDTGCHACARAEAELAAWRDDRPKDDDEPTVTSEALQSEPPSHLATVLALAETRKALDAANLEVGRLRAAGDAGRPGRWVMWWGGVFYAYGVANGLRAIEDGKPFGVAVATAVCLAGVALTLYGVTPGRRWRKRRG